MEVKLRFVAWYSILVGVFMLVQWGFTLGTGQAPEVRSEPTRLTFHVAAEFVTATMLIVSGIGLLRRTPGSRLLSPAALGMLLYTVIVSPGYFAQQGRWAPVMMFAILLLLTVFCLVWLWKSDNDPST
jgi:hypothetical protein